MKSYITEDYCSYEIAKLLKDKGFEILTDKVYDNQNKLDYQNIVCWQEKRLPYMSAPTHQMAMKWLREVYKIMITIIPQEINVGIDKMCYAIYRITEDLYQPLYNGKVDNLVDSYEETVEAALKYSLEKLI